MNRVPTAVPANKSRVVDVTTYCLDRPTAGRKRLDGSVLVELDVNIIKTVDDIFAALRCCQLPKNWGKDWDAIDSCDIRYATQSRKEPDIFPIAGENGISQFLRRINTKPAST